MSFLDPLWKPTDDLICGREEEVHTGNKRLLMESSPRNIPPTHFIFPGLLNLLCLNWPLPFHLSKCRWFHVSYNTRI